MTPEFKKLQYLIKKGVVKLRLKKHLKDPFHIWIYWFSETKKPKFFWKTIFVFYLLFSSEWFWIPFSITLTIKINKLYLLGLLMPFLITRLLKPVGKGFIIHDAQNDEALFNDLWANKLIGILSKKHKNNTHKNKVLDIVIDSFNQDWKEQINKKFSKTDN